MLWLPPGSVAPHRSDDSFIPNGTVVEADGIWRFHWEVLREKTGDLFGSHKSTQICTTFYAKHKKYSVDMVLWDWGLKRPNTVVVPGIMPPWYLLLLTAFRSLGSTMEVLMRHAALTMKCSANRCGYGWYIPLFWNIFYFSSSVCFNTYIIISSEFLGFCLTWLGCFSAHIRLLEISLTTFTKDDLQWGIFGTFEMDPTYLQLSICAQSLKPS